MKARDVLDQEIRTEGRRLLADLAAARETIDGDRVEDAKEAWVNFTYQHHDVLLADPAPVGLTDLSWVTEIKTVDAIDKVPVNAMMENPSWHLLHAGMGSGGQTTLTFGWGDRLSAAPVDDREREAPPLHDRKCPAFLLGRGRCTCRPVSPSVDPEEGGRD